MVGRAAAVLRPRELAFVGLLGALLGYYYASPHLWQARTGWDVAFLAIVLIPAVFGLVCLALPLREATGLLSVALAFVLLAVLLQRADWAVLANFAKLAAVTLLGYWFLSIFEELAWVVIVAFIIPWVDAYSVWRGPTRQIVTQKVELFSALSFSFPLPGEHAAAKLGMPDFLFFAVFLAAADRFGLRTRWTWLAMTASFGLTMVLAVYTRLFGDIGGLPALPLLAIAFLVLNGDLIWRRLRPYRN